MIHTVQGESTITHLVEYLTNDQEVRNLNPTISVVLCPAIGTLSLLLQNVLSDQGLHCLLAECSFKS